MTGPHETVPDEDPELHIGQEVPDPWIFPVGTTVTMPMGKVSPELFEVITGMTPEQAGPEYAAAIGQETPPDWPLWFGESGGER